MDTCRGCTIGLANISPPSTQWLITNETRNTNVGNFNHFLTRFMHCHVQNVSPLRKTLTLWVLCCNKHFFLPEISHVEWNTYMHTKVS